MVALVVEMNCSHTVFNRRSTLGIRLDRKSLNSDLGTIGTDLLPGVPQLLLHPRTGVEEELQQGVVRREREQVRPVSTKL